MRKLLTFIGSGILILGTIFLTEGRGAEGFFGFSLIIAGLALNFSALRLPGGGLHRWHERKLLRLAQERGGKLTTPEVAWALKRSLAEAKALLDALVLAGYAGYHVEAGGHFVYHLLEPYLTGEGPSRRRRPGLREIERQLVQLALQRGGTITTAEVVAHTSLTLDEAKAKLDELAGAGHIGYEVEEDGRITYRLADAVPLNEEETAGAVSIDREC